MRNHYSGTLRRAALTAAIGAGLSSAAMAGTPEPAPMMAPVDEDGVLTGTLSFDYNSHFVSYGFDVWRGADSFGGESTFNPSLELNWGLTDNLTLILGTWWDVNNNITSSIGGDLQEVDVWAGLGYAWGDLSITALYQAWIYGSDTEQIVDVILGYDCFLSPSLTIHNRVGSGASGGDTGTVLVPGIEYGFDLGPVSFSIPLTAGFFVDDGFHGTTVFGTTTDSGFGFLNIGLNASYPLPFDDKYGEWDIHGGITYWMTEDDVIANPSDSFLTWNIGIGCSF